MAVPSPTSNRNMDTMKPQNLNRAYCKKYVLLLYLLLVWGAAGPHILSILSGAIQFLRLLFKHERAQEESIFAFV
jgi:hypothetical protein